MLRLALTAVSAKHVGLFIAFSFLFAAPRQAVAPLCPRHQQREQSIHKRGLAAAIRTDEQRRLSRWIEDMNLLVEGAPIADFQPLQAEARWQEKIIGYTGR